MRVIDLSERLNVDFFFGGELSPQLLNRPGGKYDVCARHGSTFWRGRNMGVSGNKVFN